MASSGDGFFRNLPRNMYKVLKPEQEDILAGRRDSVYARNAIILSSVTLGPLTALFVSVALVINTKIAEIPSFTLNACLVYPLTGLAAVVIGLAAHRKGYYGVALFGAMVPPALNIGAILGGFLWWAIS
ncbi:hypothetical protein [Hwanghaeella sp.]|uniref:hypothetical protein n=1 Tax=Hwanghaeella sp. TaxID=2605943 RepID=UPI003CCC2C06